MKIQNRIAAARVGWFWGMNGSPVNSTPGWGVQKSYCSGRGSCSYEGMFLCAGLCSACRRGGGRAVCVLGEWDLRWHCPSSSWVCPGWDIRHDSHDLLKRLLKRVSVLQCFYTVTRTLIGRHLFVLVLPIREELFCLIVDWCPELQLQLQYWAHK